MPPPRSPGWSSRRRREAAPLNVPLIGIGGSGMSALAHLYLERGDVVSGSDAAASPVTHALAGEGARIAIGHSGDNIGEADIGLASPAWGRANPEPDGARRRAL